MIEYVDINSITPAPYNPRKISDEQFENLKGSINSIGCVVPILINDENNVIIAGHQRTKAMKSCGIKTVPVIKIKGIGIGDEIKFNQIHNSVDHRNIKSTKLISDSEEIEKFIKIAPDKFKVGDTTPTVVKEICKLILKYGNVLSCVICESDVYLGHNYVEACRVLNLPVNAYICGVKKLENIKVYFSQDYGQYNYDSIERKTYVQGLAQMHRSVTKKENVKQNKSVLYTQLVIPYLTKNKEIKSILDFGCGKGAYIIELGKRYNAVGVEFYNNNGSAINVTKGNTMIDNLINHVENNGLFDVVVCDSVLNSVDSIEAEYSVLKCLNAFVKDNGVVFVSGRTITAVTSVLNSAKDHYIGKRFVEYLDENNFTANYRKGQWYFQHYHTEEMIRNSLKIAGLKPVDFNFNKYHGTFQIMCVKERNLSDDEKRQCIGFEFNLPLPNNKRYGRDKDVLKVLGVEV